MTTPNIENIIKSLVVKAGVMEMGEKIAWGSDTALMRQAAAALQTQAERIKELEAEIITRTSYGDEQTDFAIKLAAERDALRAQLAEIEKQEPVLVVEKEPDYWSGGHFHEGSKPHIKTTKVWRLPISTKLFTRPMPAQDVTELVEALEKLARLGNGDQYGNSDGNMIARMALSKYKGAKRPKLQAGTTDSAKTTTKALADGLLTG